MANELGVPRMGSRTRPLGKVKTESLHFHSVPPTQQITGGRGAQFLGSVPSGYAEIRRLYGEEGLKASVK